MNEFFIGMIVSLVVVGAMWIWLKAKRSKTGQEIHVFSSIEKLRAIGQLSVYKVLTKERSSLKPITHGANSARAI